MMDQYLERMASAPPWTNLLGCVANQDNNLVINKAYGGGFAATIALLARRLGRPVLVITSSIERAEALTDGATFFGADPFLFPPFETLPFEVAEPVLHITAARSRALARLTEEGADPKRAGEDTGAPSGVSSTPGNATSGGSGLLAGSTQIAQARIGDQPDEAASLIIAPIDALAFRTLPREVIRDHRVHIRWGEELNLARLASQLVEMGYRRESLVESPGEFAIRGSIVDIYPADAEWPWRLDLFGEEIEQIRRFDPTTQRSLPIDREIESIEILARACHEPKLRRLKEGESLSSIIDLFPPNTLILLDGPTRLRQRLTRFGEIAHRHWEDLQKHRGGDEEHANALIELGIQPDEWLLTEDEIWPALEQFQTVTLADLSADTSATPDEAVISLGTQSFDTIPAQFTEYLGLIRERLRKGHRVAIVCDNNGQVMRLDELLRENEVSAVMLDSADAQAAGLPTRHDDPCHDVLLTIGQLHEGFHQPTAGVFVVTDREMFGRYKRRHIYRKAHHGRPVANPAEIHRGDFVVHVEHGIGLFEGIRRQTIDGRMGEFLDITYQDNSRLLVPVEKLHMIQKYASADGKAPTLDQLGSKRWARRRKKSMETVRKLAGELLELYARREVAEGFAYGEDTVWQQEFEASFIYQETPDQLEAIEQVKRDLCAPRPMDRLLCGDVGYGKTEVAIRAAFKALLEGRQVAVLAPTTLLVQQHYTTFTERFADYPFKVGMLSRFRSPKQIRATLDALAAGEIQLAVGTHRLLSRDVRFKDLGLLVLDEEQRFGVAQKEKIKSLRANIDALTLTATPIPRTLYMALSGLRDLSVINTPPADRHPIKTRTIRFDREIIEEALLRELNRGGQVYFVHNRIQSIQEVAQTIREIVPRVRLAVAHGQMDEGELERIMIDFIAGKYDILVSTTIIENGIDIPNVNTIVINRADTFGLAQLYQLRGRVGRDVRQAYAYLILPPGEGITPSAVKRLEALEEFTELGVGFSIAMRDMEIRGTGNILGGEQHGAITDIGFDLYCRMLEEAVRELRGLGSTQPLWPVEVKWPSDQFLPEEYIPIEAQRIRFYKDLAGARTRDEMELLIEELVDRFGALPPPAVNLINAGRLKVAAAAWQVDVIRPGPDDTVRIVAPTLNLELATDLSAAAAVGRAVFDRLKRSGDRIVLRVRDTDEEFSPERVLAALADYFEALPIADLGLRIAD